MGQYVYRASDRVLAQLSIFGPMTTAELAAALDQHPARINGWLNVLKQRGQVELIDAGLHRTARGHKCGKWRLTPFDPEELNTDVEET